MAIIKCPECGKEISDKSIACVHCGVPLDLHVDAENNTETPNPKKKTKKIIFLLISLILIIGTLVIAQKIILPANKYSDAEKLFNEEKYEDALDIFREISTFRDSSLYIRKCSFALIDSYLRTLNEGNFLGDKVTHDDLGYSIFGIQADSTEQIDVIFVSGAIINWLIINVDGTGTIHYSTDDDYTDINLDISTCTPESPIFSDAATTEEKIVNLATAYMLENLPDLVSEFPFDISMADLGFNML